MKKSVMRLAGALAGMLGRLPAQIRENMQLAKMAAVKVATEAEAKGQAADPHAAARAFKRLNRAAKRRVIAKSRHEHRTAPKQANETTEGYRRRRFGVWRASKIARACGHNTRVRGH